MQSPSRTDLKIAAFGDSVFMVVEVKGKFIFIVFEDATSESGDVDVDLFDVDPKINKE